MFINEILGIGTDYDAMASTALEKYSLSKPTLEELFKIPACKKVVSYYPVRMAQVWGRVQIANSNQAEIKYKKFFYQLRSKFEKAQILANLYGSSCLVRDLQNGSSLASPLQEKELVNIDNIKYKGPFDRWEIYPDPSSGLSTSYEDIYNPEFYYYTSNLTGLQKVHRSRILRFRGDYAPPTPFRENNYCEYSLLLSFLPSYLRYALALISISNSLKLFNMPVFEKENLETIKTMELDNGGLSIQQKMKSIVQKLSAAKGITLDKSTEALMFPTQNNYSNVDNTLQMLKEEMIADSGLTKPQFYQEFPTGLAATGESERIQEAAALTDIQETKWGDLINQEVRLIALALGDNLDDIEWAWNSAYFETPSHKQKVKVENANLDQIYFNMGVLSAKEIRKSRFEGTEYGEEIILETSPILKQNQDQCETSECDKNKSDHQTSPSEKFIPDGDVLPESDFEELTEEELREIEEDYE